VSFPCYQYYAANQSLVSENEPARAVQVWTELLGLLGAGRVRPVVYNQVYTLENLIQGLKDLEDRKTWGKAIVQVRSENGEQAKAKL
jgi:NADPH2:quinone reductase